jgi:membrane fusion protein (multidrug efflux system)
MAISTHQRLAAAITDAKTALAPRGGARSMSAAARAQEVEPKEPLPKEPLPKEPEREAEAGSGLFRKEALHHHVAIADDGDILRLDARWPLLTYHLVWIAAALGLVFACAMSVHEYATGPAVVRVHGRRMITATIPATVENVLVRPGERVKAGAVLVRMHDSEEEADLRRVSLEFELELVRLLRDPNDAAAKTSLGALRSKRDQARNILSEREIHAPVDGTVGDLRVWPGQRLNAGDTILGMTPEGSRVVVVAAVSGDYRPMLEAGLPVRFSLDGFHYEYRDLEVVQIADEVIGPPEVKRFLGQELNDALQIQPGPKVLVTARLDSSTFTSDGVPYGYYDGLTGLAEVRVRREPIITMLIPALKQVLP